MIPPSLSLPPLEFCFGTSPIQAAKSRAERKPFGSGTLATRAVASAGPTPGMASSRRLDLVGPMPCHDHAVELQDLRFDTLKLSSQQHEAAHGIFRQTLVVGISDHVQQVLDAVAADRRHDTEFGQVRADGIDQRVCCLMKIAGCDAAPERCCSVVLISTNRMLGRVTASQIASASAASFFCRFTYGFT